MTRTSDSTIATGHLGPDPLLPAPIQPLTGFGIPFLLYRADGRRSFVSPAAAALLEQTPKGIAIGRAADAIAADAVSAAAGRSLGVENLRDGGSIGPIALDFHWVREHGHAIAGVVILRPARVSAAPREPILGLSPRQSEIAELVARGMATKEIAGHLGISAHTARHHIERIFARLCVRSRARLALLVGFSANEQFSIQS